MLRSRLPKIMADGATGTSLAVRHAEAAVERRAKEKSRVDTGTMRAGWQSREMGPFDGMVFNLTSYTIYNEFGTVNMSAQPMAVPAAEETRPEFEAEVRAAWR